MHAAANHTDAPPAATAPSATAAPLTAVRTGTAAAAKDHAAAIAEHFKDYNEEFGRITRRAAMNFLAEDWHSAQSDAVARIELYEQRVARCVAAVGSELRSRVA